MSEVKEKYATEADPFDGFRIYSYDELMREFPAEGEPILVNQYAPEGKPTEQRQINAIRSAYREIPHNTIRFQVQLAYGWPMFEGGEMNKDELVEDLRQALIDVVNRHAEWNPEMVMIHPSQDKPTPNATEWLHDETMVYDLS